MSCKQTELGVAQAAAHPWRGAFPNARPFFALRHGKRSSDQKAYTD